MNFAIMSFFSWLALFLKFIFCLPVMLLSTVLVGIQWVLAVAMKANGWVLGGMSDYVSHSTSAFMTWIGVADHLEKPITKKPDPSS
jgi:hypothetical protein